MTDRNKVEKFQEKTILPSSPVRLGQPGDLEPHLRPLEGPHISGCYAGIGTVLRAERQRLAISLLEVSNKLRIQRDYLAALEEGRTGELPGMAYATGFLRTYSEYLGLDGAEIVRLYKSEGSLTFGEQRLVFLEPLEGAPRPGLTLALFSLVVAGIIYCSWIFFDSQNQQYVEAISEPPRRFLQYKVEGKASKYEQTVGFNYRYSKNNSFNNRKETKLGMAFSELQIKSEHREPTIEEKKLIKLDREDVSKKIKTKLNPGDGEQAAAADVAGLLRNNKSRPVNTNSPPLQEDENNKATELEKKTLRLVGLKKQQVAEKERSDVSRMMPDEKINELNSRPIVPTIQATVATTPPLTPRQSRRLLSGISTEAAHNISEEGTLSAAASETIGHRPQAFGVPGSSTRVVLSARAGSWVQVQDVNDELILTRMLRPGDSYNAPNRLGLVLMTGNAGAIEVTIDGEPLGPLGPLGQVRRNIKLNAESLREHLHSSAASNQ